MTLNDVLSELLSHLREEHFPKFSWDETRQWPDNALETCIQVGMLVPAPAAQSIECQGCDHHCFMDVITLPRNDPALTRSFIVCEDAEMQNQIGRINIPAERLKQWQSESKLFATVISDLLGFKNKFSVSSDNSVIRLGMLKGDKGRRWVAINCHDLTLEINQQSIQLEEVLYFENNELVIDHDYIEYLLNQETLNPEKKYTPSTTKREARKLATQAMYQDWNDEYSSLKKRHPTKSKRWFSQQIAKMNIAKGKDAETIRKNLKD